MSEDEIYMVETFDRRPRNENSLMSVEPTGRRTEVIERLVFVPLQTVAKMKGNNRKGFASRRVFNHFITRRKIRRVDDDMHNRRCKVDDALGGIVSAVGNELR